MRGKLKKLFWKISLKNSYYNIDGHEIDLGQGHLLPKYQKSCPLFYRIFPYLGELSQKIFELDGKRTVIDVGANVGDTLAGMFSHTNSFFLCVEPTSKFVELLQRNALLLDHEKSRYVIVQAYISNVKEPYISIVSQGGTATKQIVSKGMEEACTFTIPELCTTCNITMNSVALIKTSTSGYDAACILSLGAQLKKDSPVLYIETDMESINDEAIRKKQYSEYIEMDEYLEAMGYTDAFVFDNFGNMLCKTDFSKNGVQSIHRYLLNIALRKSARSFYYIYILACKENYSDLCEKMINQYNDDILNNNLK